MNEKPLNKLKIIKIIENKISNDMSYKNGRIISSMCTYPDTFGVELFSKYIDKNIGDSKLFPGVVEIEKEVIKMIGSFLNNRNCNGSIVTGGTEANLIALWAFRELSGKTRIILPETSHFSLFKIANILKLNVDIARVDSNRKLIPQEIKKLIKDDTFCIVAMAGSTGLGVIDPIREISEICLDKNIFLHIDAAFGGFVIPFLKKLGYDLPDFDFSVPGVSSITVDPHKMGLAPIPAGGILFRDEHLRNKIKWRVDYLSGGITEQTTFVGSRSGGSVIAVWGLMKKLGMEGYKKIIKECMNNTHYFVERLDEIENVSTVMSPVMNIIGIKSDLLDIKSIAKGLRKRGWAVSLFPEHIRIVVTPSVTREVINYFIQDLKEESECIQAKI